MKDKLLKKLERDREKLNYIQNRIHRYNCLYLFLIENEDEKHLNLIKNEIGFLEHQQESIVKSIRRSKKELKELEEASE